MIKLKQGDVVNFKANGFFQTIIKLFNLIKYGETGYVHSGIISEVDEYEKLVWIHEAIETNGEDFKAYPYEFNWLENRINEKKICIRRYGNLKNLDKIIKSYENVKYDWLSIILMPFKLAINSTNKVFCSEVVSRILYDASDKEFNMEKEWIKYEKVTPQDLQLTKQLKTIYC